MAGLPFYLASIAAGLLFGWSFARLWRLCAPRAANRRFWSTLADIARQMLAVDELALLLRLYGRLARAVGGYVVRNLGGLVLACLPVGAFLLLVAPAALALWDRGADRIALHPSPAAWQHARAAEHELLRDLGQRSERVALCSTAPHCTLFRLLGFRVIERPAPLPADAPYLVARAERGAGNFLWPYLNDLELAFAGAFLVASIGSLVRRGPARR